MYLAQSITRSPSFTSLYPRAITIEATRTGEDIEVGDEIANPNGWLMPPSTTLTVTTAR